MMENRNPKSETMPLREAFVFSLLLCLFAAGCQSGPRNYTNENDRLREEAMKLRQKIEHLTQRADAAEKQLEIEKSGGAAGPLPRGVQKPVTTRVEIVKPSRGIDTDKNGSDDAVRLYLETYDYHDRFLPTVGKLQVSVAAIPAGGQALTVGLMEFDAKAFDEAYRSGLAGTHYTLVVPLTAPVPQGVETLTVTVKLTDLLTGATLDAAKIVNFTQAK